MDLPVLTDKPQRKYFRLLFSSTVRTDLNTPHSAWRHETELQFSKSHPLARTLTGMTIPLNDDTTVQPLPPPSAPILPPPAYNELPQRSSSSDESTNHNSMYNSMPSTRYQNDVALALAMSIQEEELNGVNPSMRHIDNSSNNMWQSSRNAVALAVEEDAEIAKRMQQEERDAHIARGLQTSEQQQRGHIVALEATASDTYDDSHQVEKSCGYVSFQLSRFLSIA